MKTKALISFAVTVKLICGFVFAYADCCFSHAAAQIINQKSYDRLVSFEGHVAMVSYPTQNVPGQAS